MEEDRRLIEETLPIREISEESRMERNKRGHISAIHYWWARRPLVVSRAALFSSLVRIPKKAQEVNGLIKQMVELCKWESANNSRIIGEAKRLTWIDIDLENSLITLNNPEKNSKPRAFKVSQKLTAMLNAIPKEKDGPFKSCYANLYRDFSNQRKTIAAKLQNPRLLRITFHTFRHWKATMEYHKTKDILHVMQLLGHRNIKNTLIYTQLINFENDDYHSATAKTIEEATKLIDTGFEYICTHDNTMLFRKRK